MQKPLTEKLERFCQFIAIDGMEPMKAWLAAGHTAQPRAASASASRALTRDNIKFRIKELKEGGKNESKALARKTKAQKLELLEKIAWNEEARVNDIIAALKVHNEMTGDNAPTKIIQEDGPEKIANARERALTIASPLNRLAAVKK